MNDVNKVKARYAQLVEDGRRTEVFTSMPEYQWYIEHVVKPTIEENTAKIMRGEIQSAKEEWIIRGIVQGLQMMIDGPQGIKAQAEYAKQKAKELNESLKNEEQY